MNCYCDKHHCANIVNSNHKTICLKCHAECDNLKLYKFFDEFYTYPDVYELKKYEELFDHFENIKYCKINVSMHKDLDPIGTNITAKNLLEEVKKRLNYKN